MKPITLLIIAGALLVSQAIAQDQQQKTDSSAPAVPTRLQDMPEFKALTPDQQKQILAQPDDITRTTMYLYLTKKLVPPAASAVDLTYHGNDGQTSGTPAPAKPVTQPCIPAPPKKKHVLFIIPPAIQAQLNKQAAQLAKKTGVVLDTTVPQQEINKAEQPKPCVVPPTVSPKQ